MPDKTVKIEEECIVIARFRLFTIGLAKNGSAPNADRFWIRSHQIFAPGTVGFSRQRKARPPVS